jgi:hypothetical protein
MSPIEQTTSILTITRPTTERPSSRSNLYSIEDVDSTHTLSSATTLTSGELPPSRSCPLSPFYVHPITRNSIAVMASEYMTSHPDETDLEALTAKPKIAASCNKTTTNTHCTVWPDQKAWKDKEEVKRKTRNCQICSRYGRPTQIAFRICIGLVILGLVLGVGLGVSKAVGGGVWKDRENPQSAVSS